MYEMVEKVNRPLKKGELFLVLCIVKENNGVEEITPVINHPHNDVENGQSWVHYHADFRFIRIDEKGFVVNKHSKHHFAPYDRPEKEISGELVHIVLPVVNEQFLYRTDVRNISNSKLKHKCIHKGKCPHRGYPLSQVNAVDGIITCPLHGLQFDAVSKNIINQ